MAKKKLEDWTIVELETEILKLQEEQRALRQQMRQLAAVRDAKAAEESALKKFNDLPEAEQQVIRLAIEAESVESEEAVSGADTG